jgi:hypothetical protein
MTLHICPRCDATIPKATALSGSAARCPQCYAPYRPPTVPAVGSLGSAIGLTLCALVLGGLIFAGGYMLMGSARVSPKNSGVLTAEEFEAQNVQALQQQPQFQPQGELKGPPKPVVKPPAAAKPGAAKPGAAAKVVPIPEQLASIVEVSNPRQVFAEKRQSHIKLRYRYVGQAPLLLLQQPAFIVRYGTTEKRIEMSKLPGGEYTLENVIPAGYSGKVEIYFAASWGKTQGRDRISNVVSLNVFE